MANIVNNIKIDKKDEKIIRELNWNARITNSRLAKKIRLSKKGIEYRIKRLERTGVIEGYYPFINFMKLGYKYCRVFLKLQYLNNSVKKEMEKFILPNKDYNWSLWASGEYDLVIGGWCKTLGEFKKRIGRFVVKFDKNIKLIKFSFGIQLHQFPYDFLSEEKPRQEIIMKESLESAKADKTDFLILKELTTNARMPVLDISRKLKLNPMTIKKRIEKLQKNEILLGCHASINEEIIGYVHFKLLLFLSKKNEKEIKKIEDFLSSKKNIIYFVDEIGICDLDFEMLLSSTHDFFDLIRDLQENFSDSIKDYEYFIFTKTIKINFMPKDLE
jgi:DNA-binding Lrp family transcriptional regulator